MVDPENLRMRLGLTTGLSLELLRQRMVKAEAELEASRNAMRTAADAAGIKRGGLFVGSRFIERTAGEKWAVEARREGHTTGIAWFAGAIERANDPNGPFRHASAALHRRHLAGRNIGEPAVDPIEARQAEILAKRRVDLSPNAALGAPVTSEGLVAGIHAAAAKARTPTGAHEDDKAPTNALARAIVEAGRARRKMSGEEK